jgi:hypothetical protein
MGKTKPEMFENRALLRKPLGYKRDETTGDWRKQIA